MGGGTIHIGEISAKKIFRPGLPPVFSNTRTILLMFFSYRISIYIFFFFFCKSFFYFFQFFTTFNNISQVYTGDVRMYVACSGFRFRT